MGNFKGKTINPDLITAFMKIAPSVTTEIVMETALELGCHYTTVQRYLRGNVKKEPFAIRALILPHQKIHAKKQEAEH